MAELRAAFPGGSRPTVRRHQLSTDSGPNPWSQLIASAVSLQYPEGSPAERATIAASLCSALEPATRAAYGLRFKAFIAYCEQHLPAALQPLPASQATVELYLAYLANEGTIAGSGLAQVVSAINSVHTLMGFAPPVPPNNAKNKQLKRGLAKLLLPLQPPEPRLPLLAETIHSLILYGLNTLDLSELRDCFAVVVSFLYMMRGSTVVSLRTTEVVLSLAVADPNLRVLARKVKNHNTAVQPVDWVFYGDSCREVLQLAHRYFACRSGAFSGQLPDLLFDINPGQRSQQFDTPAYERMLQRSLAYVHTPPEACTYLSTHSGRIGGASAMNAAGVPKDTIRVWAKWQEVTMCDTYIREVPPTPRNAWFFGWMLARPPTFRG